MKIVLVEILPFVLGWALANFINTIRWPFLPIGLAIIGSVQPERRYAGTMTTGNEHQALLLEKWLWIYRLFSRLFALHRPVPWSPPVGLTTCPQERSAMISYQNVSLFYQTVQGT
jgi:hypothetical protein